MKLKFNANESPELQYTCDPDCPALKAAIDAIRTFGQLEKLVQYAENGHGFSTDGFFGISYPDDFDDFDLAHGEPLSEDSILIDAGYGDPQAPSFVITRRDYLELLRQFMLIQNRQDLSDRIKTLLDEPA